MADLATLADWDAYQERLPAALIAQVEAAVRSYCGWHIAPSVTETITVDGQGGHVLALPTLHLTAVTAVSNASDVVSLDDVDWSEAGYLELRCGHWTCRPRGVIATITHGYDTPPAEVVGVIMQVASRASSSPAGITREQAGSVSFSYALTAPGVSGGVALLEHERAILDHYRIPPRA